MIDRDTVIKLAREANLPDPMVFYASIERFADLIAAQEREACAQLCDIRETMFKGYKAEGLPALCAATIRARSQA